MRGENIRPQRKAYGRGRMKTDQLLLFLFRRRGGGGGGLDGLSLREALLEFVHAAGGIHEFLLARVKRMADVADTDQNRRPGRAGLDHVAAGATDFRVHILRMYICFHKRLEKIALVQRMTSPNLS